MQENKNEHRAPVEKTLESAVKPRKRKNLFFGVFLTILIIIAAMGVWMYFPVVQETIIGTPTVPPLPATTTATTTNTPTITSTATASPTPTSTPLPASAFEYDAILINPPVPVNALNVIVLNDDVNIDVEPAFDHPQWYSSEQISQQLDVVISEPFFATIGPGSAVWKMDTPLQPGFYDIFVLDTVYSSGGALDFHVFLGGKELTPLLGLQHVEYGTLSGTPPQLGDEWRSIGLYSLDAIDILSIATAWEAREMATIVSLDRVLIARQPDSIWHLLSQLPTNSPKFVVDDSSATIETQEIWYTRNDLPAWGDQLQMVVNPQENSIITWQVPNPVPPGQYDIWIWAAPMEGDADILYKVLVNGMENQGAMVANTGNMPENQWVSLGTWQASSTDGRYIRLGLRLDIARQTVGEIAIDAVAFIYRQ